MTQRGNILILTLLGVILIGGVGAGVYYFGILPNSNSTGSRSGDLTATSKLAPVSTSNIVGKFTVQVIPSGKTETEELNPADNGKKITVAVGTYIYFRFGIGNYQFITNPTTGILENPKGTYNLPRDVIYQLKAIKTGSAEVVVTQTTSDVSPLHNSTVETANWKTYLNISIQDLNKGIQSKSLNSKNYNIEGYLIKKNTCSCPKGALCSPCLPEILVSEDKQDPVEDSKKIYIRVDNVEDFQLGMRYRFYIVLPLDKNKQGFSYERQLIKYQLIK